MKTRLFFLFGCLLYSANSLALFCPKGFNQMEIGQTAAQIQTQCGKPDEVKAYKATNMMPQEWTYYIQLDPNSPITMKVTMAFIDDKINNITANGASIGATAICNQNSFQQNNIQLGDSTASVEKACGKPATITQLNLTNNPDQQAPKPVEIEEWTYSGTGPSVTLVFKNGVLTERR